MLVLPRNTVKKVTVILFSLLLLWTQLDFSVCAGQSKSKVACPRCDCARMRCCAGRSAPRPMSVPIAPQRTAPENNSLLLPVLLHTFTPLSVSQFSSVLSSPFSLFASADIPLYRRNCSFLL